MNLKITGLHFDVTEAIKNHVTEKLEHKAAAQVHLAGKDLHVEAIEADMYAAIDVLVDKLDRAIKQHKEKRQH